MLRNEPMATHIADGFTKFANGEIQSQAQLHKYLKEK